MIATSNELMRKDNKKSPVHALSDGVHQRRWLFQYKICINSAQFFSSASVL